MDLLELLDSLDNAEVDLSVTGDRLSASGPRDVVAALADDLRRHRDLLVGHVLGLTTGHVLAFCDTCGAPTLTSVKTSSGSTRETWPPCRDRPGCGGRNQHGTALARHLPRPVDLEARTSSPAPPSRPRPPAKVEKARLLGPRIPWPAPAHPSPTGATR